MGDLIYNVLMFGMLALFGAGIIFMIVYMVKQLKKQSQNEEENSASLEPEIKNYQK